MSAFSKTLAAMCLLAMLACQAGCKKETPPDPAPESVRSVKAQPAETAEPDVPGMVEPTAATSEDTAKAAPVAPTQPVKQERKMTLEDVTPAQAEQAIREALQVATQNALAQLGSEGGFAGDPNMRLSMPDEWRQIETVVRKVNHAESADAFLDALNASAENAVTALAPIVAGRVKDLPIKDARQTLTSATEAATRILLEDSGKRLRTEVATALESAFETADIRKRREALIEKAHFANPFTNIKGVEEFDLQGHAADRIVERLFVVIAREEKAIRQDPSKLETEVAQSVFRAAQ